MKFILFIFLIISTGLRAQVPNIDKIDDAVVLIKIYDYKGQYVGHGSGFSISKEGVIVTNYHVVEGSYSMKVVFDKNGYKSTYNVDKIIFVSKWTQNQFFYGIDKKLLHKTEIVYPSIHKSKKIFKKDNNIVFIGKLNASKGYDIYKDAITKILDLNKTWNAYSIGDESRDRPHINHKRH